MTGNVWHKRYHGDALNGYMGLTLEQRGAYTTILDLLYDSGWEVGIPDRERWIAGHLNVSVRRWRGLRDELIAAGKIDIIDGQISNFRYRKERENAASLSRKRSESGASGGEKSGETRRKAAENRQSGEANASDLPLYARASEAELDTDTEEKKRIAAAALDAEVGGVAVDAVSLAPVFARAAGVSIFPNRARHFADQLDVIREWLTLGLDPTDDIIPALQRKVMDNPGERHSLAYFTPMLADMAARREAKANGTVSSDRRGGDGERGQSTTERAALGFLADFAGISGQDGLRQANVRNGAHALPDARGGHRNGRG
jgi:uncharacterized protein YdaU (DUF1376 family)